MQILFSMRGAEHQKLLWHEKYFHKNVHGLADLESLLSREKNITLKHLKVKSKTSYIIFNSEWIKFFTEARKSARFSKKIKFVSD